MRVYLRKLSPFTILRMSEYVMATILVDLTGSDKQIVLFVIGDLDKLASLKNTAQIRFMVAQGWLKEEIVLSWNDIEGLHP